MDASGYFANQTIDLTPGGWSSIGGYTHNIGIYLDTIIENAIGGSGDDILIGNNAANNLYGNAGSDTLKYTGGLDMLDGGSGVDVANFSLFGSAVWVDLTFAGREAWTCGTTNLTSGTWAEIADLVNLENLVGTVHSDLLRGDGNANVLFYTGGLDTLDGGAGTDTVDFSQFGSAVWVDLSAAAEAWTVGLPTLTGGTWQQVADMANVETIVGTALRRSYSGQRQCQPAAGWCRQ